MDELYREMILEHSKHPQNFGEIEAPDLEFEDVNPFCGDEQKLQLRLDDQGKISAVGFTGQGCAISIAATSMLTEELIGKTPTEVLQLDSELIMSLLGINVSAQRVKCALLGLKVAKSASIGAVVDWDQDD